MTIRMMMNDDRGPNDTFLDSLATEFCNTTSDNANVKKGKVVGMVFLQLLRTQSTANDTPQIHASQNKLRTLTSEL